MGDEVLGRAYYELEARQDKLEADLRAAEGKIAKSGKDSADKYQSEWRQSTDKIKSHLTTVRNALTVLTLGVGLAGILNFFGGAIDAASDLNEEINKGQIVFGAAAGRVEDFAEKADKALGQSKLQAMAAAGGFGNMFKTIGFADDAAADMSMTMVALASDMGSFNNQDPSAMLERLRAGLSGEAEPLRQFGVLLSEARVKSKAYEAGIADLGAELTEAQKVQARYALILDDTALQQGDFARTSTGLANTQRINAAIWDNAMARIGGALLPLAQALANFGTEIMPGVADGILAVTRAGEPLLQLTLGLAKLWVEHIDVILPGLIALLAGKLVMAYRAVSAEAVAAATKFKLAGLAAKAAWSAALAGLPLLIEGMQAAGNAFDDFLDRTAHGDEAAETIKELQELVGHRRLAQTLFEWGVSVEQFAQLVERAGGDSDKAFRAIYQGAGDVGMAFGILNAQTDQWDEATAIHNERVRQQFAHTSRAGASMVAELERIPGVVAGSIKEVPGGISAELDNGQTIVATSAEALARKIPDAIAKAKREAAEEARLIPGEIAKAILDARDEVLAAGTGLADAATDPLVEQARIDEIRVKMREAQDAITTAIEDGSVAAASAARAEYAQLEIELAAHLLRQDPNSRAAAEMLAKYAESADPATRAAYDQLMETVRTRAAILAGDVEALAEETGLAMPDALKRHQNEAAAEAQGLRLRVVKALQMAEDAKDAGEGAAKGFADGFTANEWRMTQAVGIGMGKIENLLKFAASPPYTKAMMAGRGVMASWFAEAGRVAERERPGLARRMNGLLPSGGMAFDRPRRLSAGDILGSLGGPSGIVAMVDAPAAAGGGVSSAAGPSTITNVYQLHYNGRESQPGSASDLVDELQRMGAF